MADTPILDCIQRIRAVYEATITRNRAKALTTSFGGSNSYPYGYVRVGNTSYEFDSEDMQIRTRQVTVRHIVGVITSGKYQGETDDLLAVDVDALETALANNPFLVTEAYPLANNRWIDTLGAVLTSTIPFAVFGENGGGIQEVGAQFTLEVKFRYNVTKSY